jgi:hypothetical protein
MDKTPNYTFSVPRSAESQVGRRKALLSDHALTLNSSHDSSDTSVHLLPLVSGSLSSLGKAGISHNPNFLRIVQTWSYYPRKYGLEYAVKSGGSGLGARIRSIVPEYLDHAQRHPSRYPPTLLNFYRIVSLLVRA